MDTLIVDAGEPLLRRNAHLENFPGFPAGVNSRLLLEMMADQADRAGADRVEGTVTEVAPDGGEFVVETAGGESHAATFVIAATKNTVDYLEGIEGVEILTRGKSFVETDERGRTGVEGLYAAGRLAMQPYQTVIVAGHGASVGRAVIEDSEINFYHDWVAPAGYFTGRGRDVPPGCEEIDETDRLARERESLEVMREYFARPHPETPTQHPDVRR